VNIAPLFDIVIVIAAVVTPAVLAARVLRGGEQGSLADLFRAPVADAWPVGVQEEEPVAWAFGAAASTPAAPTVSPKPARRVVATPSAA
jgi:hypothetical protein